MSNTDEVYDLFKEILNDAKVKHEISGLEQSSFSCDFPQDGLARISGYLHASKRFLITENTVRAWILDDRISGEIEWTPVMPGRNESWKQHPLIQSILAACENGTRRLEDWIGNSSDTINMGGRPWPKPPSGDTLLEGGGANLPEGGGAPRARGRPSRPPPVDGEPTLKAEVRSRLHSMNAKTLFEICSIISPNEREKSRTAKA